MRRLAAILLSAVVALAAPGAPALSADLAGVHAALQAGEADQGLALLRSLPESQAASAEAHNLRCRIFFTLEQWDAAGNECEQAVALDGNNAAYHLWLGRALGERADRASFMSAYSLAKRARAEFERAVQLDPRNAEALADLGEFYSSAPGVVGGGTSKAANVAAQLDRIDPARAHELRSAIAQSNNDYGTAERELKDAIAVSQHPTFQWVRLASFYRHNKRWNEMENALQNGFSAAQHDRTAGVALFNGASVLVQSNRNTQLAIRMLETYLADPRKTEEAPAFVAHVWLAKLLAQSGDLNGARRERTTALSLANEYRPAQNLKF